MKKQSELDKNNYYVKEAVKAYTEGLEYNSSNNDVNCKLYSNRALANFKLSFFKRIFALFVIKKLKNLNLFDF